MLYDRHTGILPNKPDQLQETRLRKSRWKLSRGNAKGIMFHWVGTSALLRKPPDTLKTALGTFTVFLIGAH